MDKFLKYVTSVVESVGLQVEDELIVTSTGKPVTIENKPVKIPTDNAINSMNAVEDNVLVEKHKIFNPFAEDEIKKNYHLTVLQRYMSSVSTNSLLGVMSQLIELLEDENMQDKTHTSIQKFIVTLRELMGNRVKLVSKRTRSMFDKFVTKLTTDKIFIIDYKSARGDTIAGIKYNRLGVLDPVILDNLGNHDFEWGIVEKEKELFKHLIEFIIPDLPNMKVGSKSNKYPSFLSIMELYIDVQTRINFLAEELKEVADISPLIMPISKSLLDAEKYSTDIDFLPSSNKLEKVDNKPKPVVNSLLSTLGTYQDNVVNTPVRNNQIELTTNTASDDPLDLLRNEVRGATTRHGFINNGNSQIIGGNLLNPGTPTLEQSLMNSLNQNNSLTNLMVNSGSNLNNGINLNSGGLSLGNNNVISVGATLGNGIIGL